MHKNIEQPRYESRTWIFTRFSHKDWPNLLPSDATASVTNMEGKLTDTEGNLTSSFSDAMSHLKPRNITESEWVALSMTGKNIHLFAQDIE